MRIYSNLLELIGNTPLVRLEKISKDLPGNIIAKLESFNPLHSVKDRIGFSMIEKAENDGKLKQGMTIIEPTSGNTGIALAYIAAIKNYQCTIVMPDSMSIERRKIIKFYGADLILTPASEGMKGAVRKVEEIIKNEPDKFFSPQQFKNIANLEVHYKTTAKEIWNDSGGNIDIFVAGAGTGGTISGVGKFLKKMKEDIKIVAVEPAESPVLSGRKAGKHQIQGIGAGFIPEIMELKVFEEIILVKDIDAKLNSIKLAQHEGILSGLSSGAALYAAIEIAKREESRDKNIITIFPDTGERYLSTFLFDDFK